MKTKNIATLFMMILPSFAAAGVDLLTGAYVHRVRLPLPQSDGRDWETTIQYSSRSLWTTNLGFGWCGDWNAELEAQSPGRYRLRDCAGDVILESQASADGASDRILSSLGDELKINAQGTWLFRRDGSRSRFSPQGLIQERIQGPRLERFTYDGFGRIRQWHVNDRVVVFSYPGLQRQARSMGLSNGRPVRLAQKAGNLEAVRIEQTDLRFEYDDLNNLTIIRTGGQVQERIQYDRWRDRVSSVWIWKRQESWSFLYQEDQDRFRLDRFIRETSFDRTVYGFSSPGLLTMVERRGLEPLAPRERTEFRYDDSRMLNAIVTADRVIKLGYDESGGLQILEAPDSLGDAFAATSALQGALERLAPLKDGDLVL